MSETRNIPDSKIPLPPASQASWTGGTETNTAATTVADRISDHQPVFMRFYP